MSTRFSRTSRIRSLSLWNWPTTSHSVFFLNDPAPTEIYTLSLHDALPISIAPFRITITAAPGAWSLERGVRSASRSEEHTSELQSPYDIVCRLLLEKK